jgi:hypothetical protein
MSRSERPGRVDRFAADPKYKKRSDIMGEAAERWVAAYLGCDTDIIDALRADPGWEMVHRGQKIDVKWSHWLVGHHYHYKGGRDEYGYPTLNVWRGYQADLYVLISGTDFDAYSWAHGYATREEVLAAPMRPGRSGSPYHWIGFDYLHPLEDLL